MQDFTLNRIQVNEYGVLKFFAPIKNSTLETVLEVKVRETRILSQLKEDKQTCGLLVGKEMS